MKKFLLLLAFPFVIYACGSPAEQAEEPAVTPEVEELQISAEQILRDSEDLADDIDEFIDNL